MHMCRVPLLIVCLLCGWMTPVESQDTPTAANDAKSSEAEAAVRLAVDAYVQAFNARDAKTLAELWSPQAVYVSRSSGDQIVGREALIEEFSATFKGDDLPTLAVTTESVQFVSPNVAVEHGTAVVSRGDADPSETRYSAVYINHGGSWLLDRVTEEDVVVDPSNYEHLQGLEFLIGQWVDADEDITIHTDCQWTRNQNYISRKYSVTENGEVTSSGLQIIGWDAKQEAIRSWLFDSSGTLVQGTWTENSGSWMAQSVATLADGGSGSFTSVFRPVDEHTFGWRKVNRILDGELMPNVDEVLVVRE